MAPQGPLRVGAKDWQGPFAVTVPLDVTLLAGKPLYPALLWLLTQGVNEMEAFRTVTTPEGLGIYDHMDPAYTVFHPQEKTFSVLWTPFHPDYQVFQAAYQRDVAAYGASTAWMPQGVRPENTFDVSMVPWMSFFGVPLGGHHRAPLSAPHFYAGKVGFPRGGAGPAPYGSNPSGGVRSLPRLSAADAAPEGHCGVSPPVRKPWTFPAGLYIIRVPLYERRDCFLWQTQL